MADYSDSLGAAVRSARKRLQLTQREVANRTEIDPRTVINIEKGEGNPKLEVLYPLIRTLQIDPREIFYPETLLDSPSVRKLHLLLDTCSEEEAAQLIPILTSILDVIRAKKITPIK